MDKTVRALEDLWATDRRLQDDTALTKPFVQALTQRRAALRDSIPEAFLTTYDALARRSRGPVVVQVRNSHCGGCYLRLPPQLDSAVRHRQSLRVCPHCRRLLYSPAPAESEKMIETKPEPAPLKSTSSKRTRWISGRRHARERPPSAARQERRSV